MYRYLFGVLLALFSLHVVSAEDSRTPEQRYEGAFIGARALCGMTHVLSKKVAEMNAKGMPVEEKTLKMADLNACLKKQLGEMANEYKNFLALQNTKGAKDALTEHYVAAVLAVKSLSPFIEESDAAYKERQIENKRKADEKWVRFEMEK
jgi:hypothetical protein